MNLKIWKNSIVIYTLARWFDVENLPSLAFDHKEVLRVALRRLALKVYLQWHGVEGRDERFAAFDLERLQCLIPWVG